MDDVPTSGIAACFDVSSSSLRAKCASAVGTGCPTGSIAHRLYPRWIALPALSRACAQLMRFDLQGIAVSQEAPCSSGSLEDKPRARGVHQASTPISPRARCA